MKCVKIRIRRSPDGSGSRSHANVRLLSNTGGAVLPEFVVVIGPLLAAFFSLMQLVQLYVSDIALKNATLVACRAAIVTQAAGGLHNPDPNAAAYAHTGYLTDAARAAMAPRDRARFASLNPILRYDGNSRSMEVRMDATFNCTIPLGWRVACGGGMVLLRGTARLPYQGVAYD